MQPGVAITGMGIVSALGWSLAETWAALESERSGLGPLTLFESPCCGHVAVGEVKGGPPPPEQVRRRSRNVQLAVHAAREASGGAGLERLSAAEREDVGVVLGTCTGGIFETETYLQRFIADGRMDFDLLRDHPCAAAAEAVAGVLDVHGIRSTVSDACASGAMAIAAACDLLASSEARIVLAGGVDTLTRLTLNGFCSLLVVSPDGCRPFDAKRNGMSLGEGAAVLVLELEETAQARGAKILARLRGCGASCDAYHPTAPRPDGSGAARAMRAALSAAGMRPEDVDYINAHGSGTVDNDIAEARAMTAVFGGAAPLVSSTKRFFGHTLAAAGAIEAVACVLALQHQAAPANLGLRAADPEIGFAPVPRTRKADLDVAMSNSLGFGGNNCSLVLSREASDAVTK